MTGLIDRLKASSPEETGRRRFGVWALVALIVFLPLWWIWGAEAVAAILRPVAALVSGLFGLPGQISAAAHGDWAVATGLARADGAGDYVLVLTGGELRRFLLSFPFFAALMIAPPRSEKLWLSALIGVACLAALFVGSVVLYVWGSLAPLLNPALAPDPTAASVLVTDPLHPALAQVALIGRYVSFTIAPLFAALVLWACLNPRGRLALLGEISGQD